MTDKLSDELIAQLRQIYDHMHDQTNYPEVIDEGCSMLEDLIIKYEKSCESQITPGFKALQNIAKIMSLVELSQARAYIDYLIVTHDDASR